MTVAETELGPGSSRETAGRRAQGMDSLSLSVWKVTVRQTEIGSQEREVASRYSLLLDMLQVVSISAGHTQLVAAQVGPGRGHGLKITCTEKGLKGTCPLAAGEVKETGKGTEV